MLTHLPYMCRYSPLHTLEAVKSQHREYPATLLLTGDHDDRVVPLHSLKFIAQLQHDLGTADEQVRASGHYEPVVSMSQ